MEKQGSGSSSSLSELQCVGRLEIESPKLESFLCGSIPIITDEAFHDFTSPALVSSSDTVGAPRYQMIYSEAYLNKPPTISSTPDKLLPVTPVESRFREEATPITSNLTRKGEALAVSGLAECGGEINVIGQTHILNTGSDIEGGQKLLQSQNHQTKPKKTDDTTTARNTMWSHAEDLALISAFMQMSQDGTIGKKQTYKGLFKKVEEKYKEIYLGGMAVGLNPRTADSLRGRWTRMKEEVNAFVLAFDEASRLVKNRSGHNEDETLKSALQLYRASHNKQQDFKLLHAWTSLKEYPEWGKKMNQHHPKVPVSTIDDHMEEFGGSGSKRFRLSEDGVENCKKHIGLDKAKIAQKVVAVENQASASTLPDLQCTGKLKLESLKPVGFLCESIPINTDEAIQDFTSAALVPPSDKLSAARYQMISSERDLYTLTTLSSTSDKVFPVTPIESRSREEAPMQGGPIILNLTSKGERLAVSGLAEYRDEIDVMGKTLVLNTGPDIEEGEKFIQRQNHQTKPKNIDGMTTTRNTMWSHVEDLALISAFMQMCQDATIGKKQTYKGFFRKVEVKYNEIRLGGMIVGLSPRTADSLRGRWTRMMEDVNAFISAFNEASRLFEDRSCHDGDAILKSALQLYRSSHKKQQDFKLLHAWTSLKEYPEWEKIKDQYYPKAPVGTTDDPMEETGGSGIKRLRLSQDNIESCKQPMCFDKAKSAQKVVAVEKQPSADLQCIGKLDHVSPKPVDFLCESIPVTTAEAFHNFTSTALVPSSDTVSAPRCQMISSERDLYTIPTISSTPDVLPVTPVESRSREEAPSQGGSIMSKSDLTSKGEALAVSGLAEYQDEIDMMGHSAVLNPGPDIEDGEKLFQRQNHHKKPRNTDDTTPRNTMWSHAEDLALISAFMQMSQDATIGKKQTYKGFFKKVEEKYKEIHLGGMIVGLSPRTADSLRGRWTRMMEDINAFLSAFNEASRLVENGSCHNEDGILKSALQLYSASHKKQHNFKLLHAWTSLKEYPDWEKKKNRFHPKAPDATKDDPMEDNSDRGTKRFRLSNDNAESHKQPIGPDMAKSAQKGATSSNSHMDNISEGSASFTNSYPAHLALNCKKLQIERERLEYKKLQLEKKKLEYLCSKMDAENEVRALKAQAQKELAEAQIAAAKVTKMGLLVQLSQLQNQDKLKPDMLAMLEALKKELFP